MRLARGCVGAGELVRRGGVGAARGDGWVAVDWWLSVRLPGAVWVRRAGRCRGTRCPSRGLRESGEQVVLAAVGATRADPAAGQNVVLLG